MCRWPSTLLGEFLGALLDEVDPEDPLRANVSVSHASGWTLVVSTTGDVVWENPLEGRAPRHLLRVRRQDLERMLADLVDGRIAEVDAAPWRDGLGT